MGWLRELLMILLLIGEVWKSNGLKGVDNSSMTIEEGRDIIPT
jgi:hypothetical protein